MKSKKGVSPVISWVLLLGFAIALATMVFLWMSGQTDILIKTTVDYVEGELHCQSIRINVLKTDGSTCGKLDIYNMGYLKIDQLAIRGFDGTPSSTLYPEDLKLDLKPQSSACKPPSCGIEKDVDPQCLSCDTIEVMPIIRVSYRKAVGCTDRKVVVECL